MRCVCVCCFSFLSFSHPDILLSAHTHTHTLRRSTAADVGWTRRLWVNSSLSGGLLMLWSVGWATTNQQQQQETIFSLHVRRQRRAELMMILPTFLFPFPSTRLATPWRRRSRRKRIYVYTSVNKYILKLSLCVCVGFEKTKLVDHTVVVVGRETMRRLLHLVSSEGRTDGSMLMFGKRPSQLDVVV